MWIYRREKARIAGAIIVSGIITEGLFPTQADFMNTPKSLFNPASSLSNFSFAAKASRDSNAVPHAMSR